MIKFRGYDSLTVPNVDLQVGHRIYYPGAGMLVPIQQVTHRPDGVTELAIHYEVWGQQRRAVVRRKTANNSRIHVHAHKMVESAMTDECRFGCKIFRCPCGEEEVRHMASYGCPTGRGGN